MKTMTPEEIAVQLVRLVGCAFSLGAALNEADKEVAQTLSRNELLVGEALIVLSSEGDLSEIKVGDVIKYVMRNLPTPKGKGKRK